MHSTVAEGAREGPARGQSNCEWQLPRQWQSGARMPSPPNPFRGDGQSIKTVLPPRPPTAEAKSRPSRAEEPPAPATVAERRGRWPSVSHREVPGGNLSAPQLLQARPSWSVTRLRPDLKDFLSVASLAFEEVVYRR